jgi:hypothetical protein
MKERKKPRKERRRERTKKRNKADNLAVVIKPVTIYADLLRVTDMFIIPEGQRGLINALLHI